MKTTWCWVLMLVAGAFLLLWLTNARIERDSLVQFPSPSGDSREGEGVELAPSSSITASFTEGGSVATSASIQEGSSAGSSFAAKELPAELGRYELASDAADVKSIANVNKHGVTLRGVVFSSFGPDVSEWQVVLLEVDPSKPPQRSSIQTVEPDSTGFYSTTLRPGAWRIGLTREGDRQATNVIVFHGQFTCVAGDELVIDLELGDFHSIKALPITPREEEEGLVFGLELRRRGPAGGIIGVGYTLGTVLDSIALERSNTPDPLGEESPVLMSGIPPGEYELRFFFDAKKQWVRSLPVSIVDRDVDLGLVDLAFESFEKVD